MQKLPDKSIGLIFFSDYVFDPEETSENVYDEVGAPIVEAAMQGFHGKISDLNFKSYGYVTYIICFYY